MHDAPPLERGPARLPEPMTEEELEDFLTEAIGLYAETTATPLEELRTFAEAGLLLRNRGLVLGLGGTRFRLSIVRGG